MLASVRETERDKASLDTKIGNMKIELEEVKQKIEDKEETQQNLS